MSGDFGGSRLLRAGRVSEAGRVYMVTSNCHERTRFFSHIYNGRMMVNAFRFADQEEWTRTLAFVVMPDHFHWMFRLGGKKPLSDVVSSVKSFVARGIRQRSPRLRQVWQPGFHDRAIRSGEDLRVLARYLVANPLRADLVGSLSDYPFWDAVWLEAGGEGEELLE